MTGRSLDQMTDRCASNQGVCWQPASPSPGLGSEGFGQMTGGRSAK